MSKPAHQFPRACLGGCRQRVRKWRRSCRCRADRPSSARARDHTVLKFDRVNVAPFDPTNNGASTAGPDEPFEMVGELVYHSRWIATVRIPADVFGGPEMTTLFTSMS